MCPVANIVTSLPSTNFFALPIIKGSLSSVKIGHFGLPNLKYTGPICSAIAIVAFLV